MPHGELLISNSPYIIKGVDFPVYYATVGVFRKKKTAVQIRSMPSTP